MKNVMSEEMKNQPSKKPFKKALFTVLASTLLIGPFASQARVNAQVANNNENLNINIDNQLSNEVEADAFDAMIAELEQFLNVKDGFFVVDQIPFSIQAKYGFDVVNNLLEGVNHLNDLAESGDFMILEDLTVLDLNTPPMERNNINRSESFWWGTRQWMSTSRARDFANIMMNVSSGYAGAAILVAFIPGIGAVGGAAGGLAAIWYRNMAGNVSNRNAQSNGRGIIVDLHRGFTYLTRVQ